jgi:hypothetical protein
MLALGKKNYYEAVTSNSKEFPQLGVQGDEEVAIHQGATEEMYKIVRLYIQNLSILATGGQYKTGGGWTKTSVFRRTYIYRTIEGNSMIEAKRPIT